MDKKTMGSNVLLGLAALIWGVAFVAQSVGMEHVGAFTFNACRFLIGSGMLVPLIWFAGRRRERGAGSEKRAPETEAGRSVGGTAGESVGAAAGESVGGVGRESEGGAAGESVGAAAGGGRQRQKTAVVGGACCGCALFVASSFQQFGVAHTTVGKAGFITALYIVIVPLLGIFLKKRVGRSVWFSVGLATVGMYLLCMSEGLKVNRGDVYVFICAVCFSFHILIIDYFSPKADGVAISCVQFFTAGVLSCVMAGIFETVNLSSIMAAAVPILYAGVMSCGVAYTLQVVAQKNTDPVLASLILSLESAFSLLAGWVILGQRLSYKELGGCALMFGAIILAQAPVGKKAT